MTFEEYKAANADRIKMIVAAAAKVAATGEEVNVTTLRGVLPPDFQLSATEDHLAEIMAAESGVTGEADVKEGGDGVLDDATSDQLRQKVVELDRKVADARSRIYTLRNKLSAARGALADAINSFVQGHGPRVSQAENVRAELKASFEARAANSVDPQTATVPSFGPSVLDRSAGWSGHGSSNGDGRDFLMKQMRNGGFRRGAMPASVKGAATRLRNPQE